MGRTLRAHPKMAASLRRLEHHPILQALGLIDGMGDLAFAAMWLVAALIEVFVGLLMRCGVFAVEVLCAVLDWAGAVY